MICTQIKRSAAHTKQVKSWLPPQIYVGCTLQALPHTLATVNTLPSRVIWIYQTSLKHSVHSIIYCKIALPCNFWRPVWALQNYSAHRSTFSQFPLEVNRFMCCAPCAPSKMFAEQNALQCGGRGVKCKLQPYIQKGGFRGIRRQFWTFRRKIGWKRKDFQDYTVCRAKTVLSPLLCSVIDEILDILNKNAPWHQILVILMIFALLPWNLNVRIYAFLPQICLHWKAKSADFILFWIYDCNVV